MAGKKVKPSPSAPRRQKSQARTKPRSTSRSLIGSLIYWGLVCGVWTGIGLTGLIFYYALDMPDTDGLWSVSRSLKCAFMPATTRLCSNAGAIRARHSVMPICRRIWFRRLLPLKTGGFSPITGLIHAGWRARCSPICVPDGLCRADQR